MTKKSRSLVLNAHTIRRLARGELTQIAGGAASSWDACKCSFSVYEADDCNLTTTRRP